MKESELNKTYETRKNTVKHFEKYVESTKTIYDTISGKSSTNSGKIGEVTNATKSQLSSTLKSSK